MDEQPSVSSLLHDFAQASPEDRPVVAQSINNSLQALVVGGVGVVAGALMATLYQGVLRQVGQTIAQMGAAQLGDAARLVPGMENLTAEAERSKWGPKDWDPRSGKCRCALERARQRCLIKSSSPSSR
jgi:hypothetical protein